MTHSYPIPHTKEKQADRSCRLSCELNRTLSLFFKLTRTRSDESCATAHPFTSGRRPARPSEKPRVGKDEEEKQVKKLQARKEGEEGDGARPGQGGVLQADGRRPGKVPDDGPQRGRQEPRRDQGAGQGRKNGPPRTAHSPGRLGVPDCTARAPASHQRLYECTALLKISALSGLFNHTCGARPNHGIRQRLPADMRVKQQHVLSSLKVGCQQHKGVRKRHLAGKR